MRMERKLSKERANNQNFYAIEKSSLEHQGLTAYIDILKITTSKTTAS